MWVETSCFSRQQFSYITIDTVFTWMGGGEYTSWKFILLQARQGKERQRREMRLASKHAAAADGHPMRLMILQDCPGIFCDGFWLQLTPHRSLGPSTADSPADVSELLELLWAEALVVLEARPG